MSVSSLNPLIARMDGMNDECASLHSLIDESKKELNAVKEELKSVQGAMEQTQGDVSTLQSGHNDVWNNMNSFN